MWSNATLWIVRLNMHITSLFEGTKRIATLFLFLFQRTQSKNVIY